MARKTNQETAPKGAEAVAAAKAQQPGPVQREATPEEQAQIQAQAQRARAEVAVLKQLFAETNVAKTIAEAERDQLIQQQQILQNRNMALIEEIAALKNPKDEDNPSTEPDDGQTTGDDSVPTPEPEA